MINTQLHRACVDEGPWPPDRCVEADSVREGPFEEGDSSRAPRQSLRDRVGGRVGAARAMEGWAVRPLPPWGLRAYEMETAYIRSLEA